MSRLKSRLRDYLNEQKREEKLERLTVSLEHHTYKRIPGTNKSYREDPPNTNTKTERHSHVYAKRDGKGKELYSVNLSGSGHDGSSGKVIPKAHADFFRDQGYDIPLTNSLESLWIDSSDTEYQLIILEDFDA